MATHRAVRTPSRPHPTRRGRARGFALLAVAAFLAQGLAFGAPVAVPSMASTAAAATLPSGFVDETIVTGLSNPTVVAYAPNGRVFVAEKRGIVRTWASVAQFNSNPAIPNPFTGCNQANFCTIDIRSDVMNYWDRGLLGMAVDPNFPASPYIYVLYAYDALPGGSAPHWNAGDPNNDPCPANPGGTTDGCVITNRLDRITVNTTTGIASARTQLLVGWCQQFPSHSAGTVAFGPDGMLYVSGGEGASFTQGVQDFGDQGGTQPGTPTPENPCGDPPVAVGGNMTAPTAEGGALRSQSFRRDSGQVATLNGTVLRLNPATGAAAAGNHGGTTLDPIRQRIVAYGLRNPFRMTFRPGTSELYAGDVGYSTWEEINRITDLDASGGTPNFGWPCYENTQTGLYFKTVTLDACSSLSASAVDDPFYTYKHSDHMATSDGCTTGSASISGLAFATASSYPALYRNGLFVADYSRNCIVVLPAGPGGLPSSTAIPFESSAVAPVMLTTDPNGNIVYPDFGTGGIHRIRYQAPVASFTATPSTGSAPLLVSFDGTGSSGPATITDYDWDFGDGSTDTGSTTTHSYAAGTWTARLTVTDSNGMTASTTKTIAAGNTAPSVTMTAPTCTTNCWKVGDTIALSATGTDPEDGVLPASAFSWHVGLQHCPAPGDCHEHDLFNAAGVKNTSFAAPDHDTGSFLRITVTVKDSGGLTKSATIDEYPKNTTVNVKSRPIAVPLALDGIAGTGQVGPSTMIVGHSTTVEAAATAVVGEDTYSFSSWSPGGGARIHAVPAPATATTYTANYTLTSSDAPSTCAAAPVRTLTTAQVPGKFATANDVDWVRFKIPTSGWYRIVLGHLPVDGIMSLYSGCSNLIATVNSSGLHWEEQIRSLSAGTYALKFTSVGGASSASTYHWSVRSLSGTTPLLTTTLVASSGLRYVGDIYNTATTPRSVTITARMYSASGTLLKTVSAHPLVPVMAGRSRSPWLIATTKPSGYSYTRISVTSTSASTASKLLSVVPAATQLSPTSWQVTGTITNNTSTTVTKVAGVSEVYDTYGTPMNAAALSASPTTLAPGAQATFTITFSGLPGPPLGTTTRARAV